MAHPVNRGIHLQATHGDPEAAIHRLLDCAAEFRTLPAEPASFTASCGSRSFLGFRSLRPAMSLGRIVALHCT